ncbi:LAT2 domain-containing protein isoform X2 [Lates calcarifer]|nr:LAT2 domain-containing protein isoform X2 [Lates calcarifer]XP_050934391.1 LAT2 domain-containing protein isoform X2 [Lates calcarifer]XP_050934392.1 LAT2 domain-containing protein isoform X2 [Lates calcarifer]XP_050934393.1 LAT2 domain-containing protein isoform X2 [Lates calcarifer]
MIGNPSLLAAVLTVVSVVSLSLLSLLCLRCKRKSKVIREEQPTYNLQTFQRGGSIFAVTQSKTVTRANQISSATVETEVELSPDATDDQSDYENIEKPAPQRGSLEHTYVAPLPCAVYANEETETGDLTGDLADQMPGVYENFIKSLPIKDDDDDYENSEFLEQVVNEEEDEPDYVNQEE